MIDENAFGLLIAYHTVDNDEYALEREEFVALLASFRETALERLESDRLGDGIQVVDLGHAIYFECADGDQERDPMGWLSALRGALEERGFTTAGVVTYGGRWVPSEDDEADLPEVAARGTFTVTRIAYGSEPLRKALHVTAATQDDDERPGWGPGLYVDAEAIEALGKKLKNAPTPLSTAGGTYYRFGR